MRYATGQRSTAVRVPTRPTSLDVPKPSPPSWTAAPAISRDHGTKTCGDTYARAIRIEAPYRGVDSHFAMLPEIVPDRSWLDGSNVNIWQRLHEAIVDVEKGLVRFNGMLGNVKQQVDLGLSRGKLYRDQAKRLSDWWQNVFLPPPGEGEGKCTQQTQFAPIVCTWYDGADAEQVRGWPLWESVFRRCSGLSPGQNVDPGGRGISYRCPYASDQRQHASDATRLRELLDAAVKWLRCAQEQLYATGLEALNRREYDQKRREEGRLPDVTFEPAPPPAPRPTQQGPVFTVQQPGAPPGPTAEPGSPPGVAPLPGGKEETGPGTAVPDTEGEPSTSDPGSIPPSATSPTTTKTRKRSSGAALGIAAAAAAALLLLR